VMVLKYISIFETGNFWLLSDNKCIVVKSVQHSQLAEDVRIVGHACSKSTRENSAGKPEGPLMEEGSICAAQVSMMCLIARSCSSMKDGTGIGLVTAEGPAGTEPSEL